MHIPDGILSTWVWQAAGITASFLFVSSLRLAIRDANRTEGYLRITATAGCLFIAQMLVMPGSSQLPPHIMGSLPAVLVLSAPTASIAIASILLVQAFFFGDGGLTSFGANYINLGIIPIYASSWLFNAMRQLGRDAFWSGFSAFISGATATAFAVAAIGIEISIGKSIGVKAGFIQTFSGSILLILIEGLISSLFYIIVAKFKPSLLKE